MSTNEAAKSDEPETPPETPEEKPALKPVTEATDHPDVPVIPPIMFLLMVMAGITLDWLVPFNLGHGWGGFGLFLLLGGLGGVFWCKKLFDEAETNISPDQPTLTIITKGPYQYSRNPVYVCFLIAYLGLAALADAPVMVLLTGGLYYLLDHYVIEREEAYLEEKFGDQYLEYKKTAPRWLGAKPS